MQIFGPYRVSTAQPNSAPQRSNQQPPAATERADTTPVDQLDLSSESASSRIETASKVAVGGDIRIDRVAEIRRQIADGSYETPEKLDAALDRLLDRLA